jgi:23S rRNA (adenine2503-C2)-methyltransferase
MTTLLQTNAPAPSVYLPNDLRPSLMGLSREELAEILGRVGVPEKQRRMRMRQIWHWIYHRGATSFAEMTDISQNLRVVLEDAFSIGRPDVVTEQKSSDGTRKWLLKLAPDERGQRHEIEMVYIPEEDRGTLCISSQVGCTLTCTFLPYGHAEAGAQSHSQ